MKNKIKLSERRKEIVENAVVVGPIGLNWSKFSLTRQAAKKNCSGANQNGQVEKKIQIKKKTRGILFYFFITVTSLY